MKPADECRSEDMVSRAVVTMVMSRAARRTARPMALIIRVMLVRLRSSGDFMLSCGWDVFVLSLSSFTFSE